MILDQPQHLRKFVRSKPEVVSKADRLQPDLGGFAVACHVDVRWFARVARKEEESVWTAPEDRRANDPDCVSFPANPLRWFRSG